MYVCIKQVLLYPVNPSEWATPLRVPRANETFPYTEWIPLALCTQPDQYSSCKTYFTQIALSHWVMKRKERDSRIIYSHRWLMGCEGFLVERDAPVEVLSHVFTFLCKNNHCCIVYYFKRRSMRTSITAFICELLRLIFCYRRASGPTIVTLGRSCWVKWSACFTGHVCQHCLVGRSHSLQPPPPQQTHIKENPGMSNPLHNCSVANNSTQKQVSAAQPHLQNCRKSATSIDVSMHNTKYLYSSPKINTHNLMKNTTRKFSSWIQNLSTLFLPSDHFYTSLCLNQAN